MKLLFVCLGNICRSPMAEAIMRHKILDNKMEDIIVGSRGTSGYNVGSLPHHGTCMILDRKNISYKGIVSEKLSQSDIEEFDYIFVMDDSNLEDVISLAKLGEIRNDHIMKITDLINTDYDHVPDPWYDGSFDLTYELINEACNEIIKKIENGEM